MLEGWNADNVERLDPRSEHFRTGISPARASRSIIRVTMAASFHPDHAHAVGMETGPWPHAASSSGRLQQ
jgi:hypothetical protein